MSIRRFATNITLASTLALGVGAISAPAAFADSTPGNSHANQLDGCTHGNSGKPCRPDPQPNNGKDCLTHGNWGGVNEDHCGVSIPDESGSGTWEW